MCAYVSILCTIFRLVIMFIANSFNFAFFPCRTKLAFVFLVTHVSDTSDRTKCISLFLTHNIHIVIVLYFMHCFRVILFLPLSSLCFAYCHVIVVYYWAIVYGLPSINYNSQEENCKYIYSYISATHFSKYLPFTIYLFI